MEEGVEGKQQTSVGPVTVSVVTVPLPEGADGPPVVPFVHGGGVAFKTGLGVGEVED